MSAAAKDFVSTERAKLRRITDHTKPTAEDLKQVGNRLEQAGFALIAMHELAIDGQVATERSAEWYLTALREMSRSTFKGIDTCIQRLNCGAHAMGNFASEFDRD